MKEKKKVLLVLNTINDYRVETYNIINKFFDFTVGYNISDETVKHCEFKKIRFQTKKIGPFAVFGRNFWKECKKYDAVITSFDIHNFEFAIIPFIKRKYKLLTWSIGFRCSYSRPYNLYRKHDFLDYFACRILNAADANIIYMEKAREFWAHTSLDQNKLFVAPNTTSVMASDHNQKKSSILFVGTLYKSKGVDKLIKAFAEAVSNQKSEVTLDIVGKGGERKHLENLAKSLNMEDRVIFHGPIYDETKLSSLFEKALICVSPTQAGLTVPKSMGYGVPIATRFDAITGGEIYHIENNVTGIIYERDEELTAILSSAITTPNKLIQMGDNARNYYQTKATPYHQAEGVIKALKYSFS